jgi:DNA segregation ATPase FtsK/SpoIIIE-like protein
MERNQLLEIAYKIEQFLANNKIKATVVEIEQGPVITRYEIDAVTTFQILQFLSYDLADYLHVKSIRTLDAVIGKSTFCLEVTNPAPLFFCLADLPKPDRDKIILAVTISGRPYYVSDRGVIFVVGGDSMEEDRLKELIQAQAGKVIIWRILPSDKSYETLPSHLSKARPLICFKGAASVIRDSSKLLGSGDMYFLPKGSPEPLRLHAVNR